MTEHRIRHLRRLTWFVRALLGAAVIAFSGSACGVVLLHLPHPLRLRVDNIDDAAFVYRGSCVPLSERLPIGRVWDHDLGSPGDEPLTIRFYNNKGTASWHVRLWDRYTGKKMYDSTAVGVAYESGPRRAAYHPSFTVSVYADGRLAPLPRCLKAS